MERKKLLSIQDLSCYGQCSQTVALPVLSACGFETAVLPTAILSTHTGGFTGFQVQDLTDFMARTLRHWQDEGLRFDAIVTGYLGSKELIALTLQAADTLLAPGGMLLVDPAMADHGKLYAAFDADYAAAMRPLCARADVVLPNTTEASLLLGRPWREDCGDEELSALLKGLRALGAKAAILTSVNPDAEHTGVAVADAKGVSLYRHAREKRDYHGTGDLFSAAFAGAYLSGKPLYEAAGIAADFAAGCIRNTLGDDKHWYGVHFEELLPALAAKL